jgi:hypothetical protein
MNIFINSNTISVVSSIINENAKKRAVPLLIPIAYYDVSLFQEFVILDTFWRRGIGSDT